jgi:hypothetical protein
MYSNIENLVFWARSEIIRQGGPKSNAMGYRLSSGKHPLLRGEIKAWSSGAGSFTPGNYLFKGRGHGWFCLTVDFSFAITYFSDLF